MDDHKIAFIMCVNDTENALETEYYINQLRIPKGYSTDIITVYDAESMAAGYNAAMKSSDAGIKVYLHQDTRIIKGQSFFLWVCPKWFRLSPSCRHP